MATGCHAKDTQIIMYDGAVKLVQDVCVGDRLMGDDSTPRNVLALARGNEKMYKITPVKGDCFVVNENHILSLKRTPISREKDLKSYPNEIENVSVKDYILWSNTKKHLYKLYRKPLTNLSNIGSPTHPYWIGLWLGDGSFEKPHITTPDKEIEDWFFGEFKEFCSWNHPEITIKKTEPKERCVFYTFTMPEGHQSRGDKNSLGAICKEMCATGEKRILSRILRGDFNTRLQVLAGLIDSDGYLNEDGCGIEFTTKYNGLAQDVLFLCRSLGLAAYVKEKIGKISRLNFEGLYYRIHISGDTNIIPCKIKRKQAQPRKQKKNVLVTGFSLEELPPDDFYGFALDGNHLYLTGDFTVHHNTGKTFTLVKLIEQLGFQRVLWITHTETLIEQSALAFLRDKFDESFANHVQQIGFLNYVSDSPAFAGNQFKMGCIKAEIFQPHGSVVMASVQTLYRRLNKLNPADFDCIVTDEAHLFLSKTFSEPLRYFTPELLIGATATPHRADGVSMGDVYDEIVYEYNIGDAIKDGNLCELDGIRIKTNISLDSVRTTAGELNQKDLADEVNCFSRNKLICDSYLKYASERQGIFFCVDIQHAVDLHEVFAEQGIKTAAISSNEEITGDKNANIRKYQQGKLDCLMNVNLLTAGFDHPDTGVIGNACPTKSLTKYLQGVGRGTRLKSPGFRERFGNNCIILDFVDNTSKHSLINCWSLDKGLDPEERVFITSENREKLIESRRRRIEGKHDKDERIQLLPILTPKFKTTIKSLELASEAQKLWLKDLGYNIDETVYTKENAREILGSLPATKTQLIELKELGFDITEPITRGQAGYSIWMKRNNKLKNFVTK